MSVSRTIVSNFEVCRDEDGSIKESIRQNIFLCKEVSNEIQAYVENENWGIKNRELYHLLDYKFRVSCIKKQIKAYKFVNDNNKEEEISIFHTGLLRKYDSKPLFIICVKNTQKQPAWMVAAKPKKDEVIPKAKEWLLTAEEIACKYGKFGVVAPPLIQYYNERNNPVYFTHYQFNWNVYHILRNILRVKSKKKMIMDELRLKGINTGLIAKRLCSELTNSFETGLNNSIILSRQCDDFVKKGLFINKDKMSFTIDLMMCIKIKYQYKEFQFVIRFRKGYGNYYQFVDLLNQKKGYQNARQLARLPQLWWYETNNNNNNKINTNNNKNKINTNNNKNYNYNNNNNYNQFENESISQSSNNMPSDHESQSLSDQDSFTQEKDTKNNTGNEKLGANTYINEDKLGCKKTLQNVSRWETNTTSYEFKEIMEYDALRNTYTLTKEIKWHFKYLNLITIHKETNNEWTSITKNTLTNKNITTTKCQIINNVLNYIYLDHLTNLCTKYSMDMQNNNAVLFMDFLA